MAEVPVHQHGSNEPYSLKPSIKCSDDIELCRVLSEEIRYQSYWY
jgi:hypothetical protein